MRACACGCGEEFAPRNRNHRFAGPSCRARGDAPIEVDPVTEIPPAPSWLGTTPRAVWDELAPLVFTSGPDMLTGLDVTVFATLCESVAHFREACEILDATAVILESGGKFSTNPAWQVARQQARLVLQLAEAFGLTPRARGLLATAGEGVPTPAGPLPEGVTVMADWVAELAGGGGRS